MAFRTHPRLAALYQDWRASVERANQSGYLPEPRLTWVEYIEETQTRTGPQERSFGLSQSFPWFGQRGLDRDRSNHLAEVSRWRLLAGQLALDEALRSAWADWFVIGRSKDIQERGLRLLEDLRPVILQEVSASTRDVRDVHRIDIEIGRLRDRIEQLQRVGRAHLSRLRSLSGADLELLEVPSKLEFVDDKRSIEALLDDARIASPELAELAALVDAASVDRKLAKKEYFPEFSIGVQTVLTGSALSPATPGSGDDPWMLSLGLELPIWIPKYRAAGREARHRELAAALRKKDRELSLEAEVEQAFFDIDDAKRRAELYRRSLIPTAQQTLKVTNAAYRGGRSTFLELVDAESAVLEFELALAKSEADRFRAESRLDRITGRSPVASPETETER